MTQFYFVLLVHWEVNLDLKVFVLLTVKKTGYRSCRSTSVPVMWFLNELFSTTNILIIVGYGQWQANVHY